MKLSLGRGGDVADGRTRTRSRFGNKKLRMLSLGKSVVVSNV